MNPALPDGSSCRLCVLGKAGFRTSLLRDKNNERQKPLVIFVGGERGIRTPVCLRTN